MSPIWEVNCNIVHNDVVLSFFARLDAFDVALLVSVNQVMQVLFKLDQQSFKQNGALLS